VPQEHKTHVPQRLDIYVFDNVLILFRFDNYIHLKTPQPAVKNEMQVFVIYNLTMLSLHP